MVFYLVSAGQPNRSVDLARNDPRTVSLPDIRKGLGDTSWYQASSPVERRTMMVSLASHFQPDEIKSFPDALNAMSDSFEKAVHSLGRDMPHAYRHKGVILNISYTLLCEVLHSRDLDMSAPY